MKLAQDQIEQRKNYLMKHIMNQFNVQHNALQDIQKQIQEDIDVLNKNITEAKNITKAGYVSKLKSITECLEKVNTETEANLSRLDLGENCLLFDSNKGVEEFNSSLSALGQVCTKGFLPSMIAFKDTEAKAGLTATLTLEVYNHRGDKFPIPSDSLSVQVTDFLNGKVHAKLCKTGSDYTVTFLPQTAGLYEVSVMFQGQRVNGKQSHISVTSNNRVFKFGNGNGTFDHPWSIAIDNNDWPYVTDTVNYQLIQKFTAGGKFLSQSRVDVHDKNFTTCGIELDLHKGFMFCPEILLIKDR